MRYEEWKYYEALNHLKSIQYYCILIEENKICNENENYNLI